MRARYRAMVDRQTPPRYTQCATGSAIDMPADHLPLSAKSRKLNGIAERTQENICGQSHIQPAPRQHPQVFLGHSRAVDLLLVGLLARGHG